MRFRDGYRMNVMLEREDADQIKDHVAENYTKTGKMKGVGQFLTDWFRRHHVLETSGALDMARQIGESCKPPKTVDEILRDSVKAVHQHRFKR